MSITTNLEGCARCGGDHEALVFEPLANAADAWDHWAPCPTTRQPILLATLYGVKPISPEIIDERHKIADRIQAGILILFGGDAVKIAAGLIQDIREGR